MSEGRFSNWANDTLQAGATLEVMPPTGRFVLPPSDGTPRRWWRFAAGAGITPIMAMLKHALVAEPNTSFTLIYGNRTPQSILFREELEDLKDRHLGRFTLLHVLSRNEELSAPLFEGRITGEKVKAFAATLFEPAEVAHVFLCGPGSMIKEARNALLALGMPREKIHFEFFAPAGGGADRRDPGITPTPNPSPQGGGELRARPAKPRAPRRSPSSMAYATASSCRRAGTWSMPPWRRASACPTRARAACAAPAAPGSSRARPR